LILETNKVLVVEGTAEKQQLLDAPTSITGMAYCAGFQVLITRRTGEQPIISQVPGIVTLAQKLVEAGFEPVRETAPPALPTAETKETGKEKPVPNCQMHNISMVWREGVNSANIHYTFWACPQKNPDGTFCKYRPGK
jgi:hypothetical protein